MNKEDFIKICDSSVKLIRADANIRQDNMAVILGISKKTLVEIEKGRSSLGWTGSVALCSLFGENNIILSKFGSNPHSVMINLAFDNEKTPTVPLKSLVANYCCH